MGSNVKFCCCKCAPRSAAGLLFSNCFDATFRSFETHVLPQATRRGIAVLGMKSLGGSGEMVRHGGVTAQQGLRYAMSLPVATTISGIDSMEVLDQNLAVATHFQPFTATELK